MAAKEKPARGKSLARNGKEIFRDFFFFAAISFFGKPSAQVHLVSAGEIGRVLEEGREGRFVRSFGGGSVCISSLIYSSLSLSTSASKVPFLLPQGGGGGEGGWCGEGGAI